MSFINNVKDLLGSTEQATAGHSADNLSYGWFDQYRLSNRDEHGSPNYSQLRLEKSEHHEWCGSDMIHKVQFVKCKPSQGKVFVTWFFPELSTIGVEGKQDRIVTLTTEGAMPSSGSGALRKAIACLRGLRLIESDDELLHPNLYTYIESETGLSMEDLSDPSKFNPSSDDNRRPYRIPGLILNIVNHTSEKLMTWFQNEGFDLKALSGVDLQCKLTARNGKTYIMSKSGSKGRSKVNKVKAIDQADAVVTSEEDLDF